MPSADRSLSVGLVYGSVRTGRFCDTVAGWARRELERQSRLRVIVIDPREQSGAALTEAIAAADAFIVVTPEYNHGYTSALKALIDGRNEPWHAKPVAFVSYGGTSGGLRAVEQLRLVFAELHAVGVRDSVSFANAHDAFDGAGRPLDQPRARGAMDRLLDSLTWWAAVLRHGRRVAPYAQRVA